MADRCTPNSSTSEPPPPPPPSQQPPPLPRAERTPQSSAQAQSQSPTQKAEEPASEKQASAQKPATTQQAQNSSETSKKAQFTTNTENISLPPGWEDDPDYNITRFEQLPHRMFGTNQHIRINEDFKRALQQMLWQFRAPIRYGFAYGSGVFSQSTVSTTGSSYNPATSPHPNPPEAIVKWQQGGGKMIDMIYGVSYTQHWHSLNLHQHRDHYSGLRHLGSAVVSRVQDSWGAGVYFNPYITINGTLIKYGVVNLDTLARDLSTWDTLYLAGRLHKPVKILRDDPRVRLANQINLISAVRVALLMLPEQFTEKELYTAIASISYMGDPRMTFWAENPHKVKNIVENQLPSFRQLYHPLIEDLPNVAYVDPRCKQDGWITDDTSGDCKMRQDMDPIKRGNMVRRLPTAFREKVYFLYQKKFSIPGKEFVRMLEASKDEDESSFKKRQGGEFDRRIAQEDDLREMVRRAIRQTVSWPSTSQSIKSFLTAGVGRSWRYFSEKRQKNRAGSTAPKAKPVKDSKEE
ncbi:mitochondrial matrix Mmp37 [Rhizodiscina lignyota]|uniref:Phosphatidate cytidylyltransferase, mitochondrial n=1 Tax=Rhizodiscina lignyota TaxID=1504668 RepID=A0A9P4IJV2_9PEZI|nr:mitochondrial matrix Mmp37 [Rhizodiscina lignyota]